MANKKEKVIKNIKTKLESNYLLRAEMDNPYIEEYINVAVEAIVEEIYTLIEENSASNVAKEIMNNTRTR